MLTFGISIRQDIAMKPDGVFDADGYAAVVVEAEQLGYDYVFAPADATTAGRLSAEVTRALGYWEPRIDVKGVDVSVDEYARNTLYINITYEVKGSYDTRNLVFPFYVIPEEGGEY